MIWQAAGQYQQATGQAGMGDLPRLSPNREKTVGRDQDLTGQATGQNQETLARYHGGVLIHQPCILLEHYTLTWML